jgi:hypothetical protein
MAEANNKEPCAPVLPPRPVYFYQFIFQGGLLKLAAPDKMHWR